MGRRRRKWIGLLGAAAGVALTVCIYVATVRSRDLPDMSTAIWAGPPGLSGSTVWLAGDRYRSVLESAEDVTVRELCLRPDATVIEHTYPLSKHQSLEMIVDPSLRSVYTPMPGEIDCGWSSQGKLAWSDQVDNVHVEDPEKQKTRVVTNLHDEYATTSVFHWLPDGKGLVTLNDSPADPEIRIASPYTSGKVRRIRLSQSVQGRILGCTPDRRLVVCDNNSLPPNQLLTLCPLAPETLPAQPTRLTIALPAGYRVCNVLLAPDGETMLWYLTRLLPQQESPVLRMIHHLLHTQPHAEASVWVDGLHHLGLRRIGTITYSMQDLEGPYKTVKDSLRLTWLPDSKRFSFVYHNRLFIRSAHP
jgi:hypothetical protein